MILLKTVIMTRISRNPCSGHPCQDDVSATDRYDGYHRSWDSLAVLEHSLGVEGIRLYSAPPNP